MGSAASRPQRRVRTASVVVGVVATLAATTLTPSAGAAEPRPLAGAPEWRGASVTRGRAPDLRTTRGRRLTLDPTAMARTLVRAPRARTDTRPIVMGIPTPEGGVARFAVSESPVVEPGLAIRHPETRAYAGTGIDDPNATVRLDLGPLGFHAQVRAPGGGWLVDPEVRGDDRSHIAYRRAGLIDVHGPRRATVPRQPVRQRSDRLGQTAARTAPGATAARTVGAQLRTYRLALATTGEYSQYFGGTVSLVNNALVAAVNRINGIFVPELGVRLVLVAGNSALVSLDPATDPYSNANGGALLTQNQARIDAVIGSANYDVGHVFSTGGGGLAALGVVGLAGLKAQGETGSSAPNGDAFWIDYVAHELGHQFGGNHTFNGVKGSCSGNGEIDAAVEPGSGTTIMGYAGICDSDDLQARDAPSGSSDPYFHAKSFDEIQTVVTSLGQGGTVSATGNLAPVVTVASAGTVPPRTPFALRATATDGNLGDTLTMHWEQYDAGGLRALTNAAKPNGALFRSFPPTAGASSVRTFPRMTSILANTTNAATGSCPALPGGLACWSEFLPTSARNMKFRATARDNRTAGGGVANADATVTVAGTAPFRITSQNSPTSVAGGAPLTVTWNVTGTTAPPFSFANVEIRLTTNGGASYTTLAASTPNDGSQSVTVPAINTTTARIQVRPVGAIFFDVNDANLTVSSLSRLLGNPGFENGTAPAPWTASTGVIGTGGTIPARTGSWRALLGGDGTSTSETLAQTVSIPTGVVSASLAFWLRTATTETTNAATDTLTVQLRNPATDALIATLGQYSNLNAGASYTARILGLTPYAGKTVRIAFVSQENAALATSFAVDDAVVSVQLLGNGGFESGSANPAPWIASAGVVTDSGAFPARTGAWKARFGGTGATSSWTLNRPLSVPTSAAQAVLACWLRVTTDETGTTAYDTLAVQLRNAATNALVSTVGQYSNLNAGSGYVKRSYDVSAYRGQSLRLSLTGQEDSSFATSFLLDDCTLTRF